jgi:hypothetical protein
MTNTGEEYITGMFLIQLQNLTSCLFSKSPHIRIYETILSVSLGTGTT